MIIRLGPHDITGGAIYDEDGQPSPVKRYVQKANIVKSVGNTAAISVAREDAVQVYRWPFSETEQSEILDTLAAPRLVNTILNGLGGHNRLDLYVELLNEVGKGRRDQYVQLCKLAIPLLHDAGVLVAGPSWATGDYEQEDWDAFKGLGFDAISLHAYWSTAGFTIWNALRWRQFWKPGDPPVIVTECGRDRVRDGNLNVNDGWLPLDNSGSYGWQASSQQCTEEMYLQELRDYDAQLDSYVIGATVFTSSPGDW